jgi:hypothetical protein
MVKHSVSESLGELLLPDTAIAVAVHLLERGRRQEASAPVPLLALAADLQEHLILLQAQVAVAVRIVD